MNGFNRAHAVLGTSSHCIATYPGDFAQALIALDATLEIRRGPDRRKSTLPICIGCLMTALTLRRRLFRMKSSPRSSFLPRNGRGGPASSKYATGSHINSLSRPRRWRSTWRKSASSHGAHRAWRRRDCALAVARCGILSRQAPPELRGCRNRLPKSPSVTLSLANTTRSRLRDQDAGTLEQGASSRPLSIEV